MINSGELICTTKYLTLQARRRTNRCHYNRVRLYFKTVTAVYFLIYYLPFFYLIPNNGSSSGDVINISLLSSET
jgi:hypothetical protein